MKSNTILLVALVLLLGPRPAFPETNPMWLTEISMSPATPLENNLITFAAKFKVTQGPVNNLKVIALRDNIKIFEQIYPHLDQEKIEPVTVQWTATLGNHNIKFIIDPDNTSGDSDRSDNERVRNFTVSSRLAGTMTVPAAQGPDLEVYLYSVNKDPVVGDTIELSGRVTNIGKADSKPCDLIFKMGSNFLPPSYPVPLIKQDRHFEVTISQKLEKWGTYNFRAELLHSTDKNKDNNSAVLPITPRAPDLVISKWEVRQYNVSLADKVMVRVWVKNKGNADSGRFEIDAYFDPCPTLAQGRRWAHVDNLAPNQEISKDILHHFHCVGTKRLTELRVDNANQVIESNERNNIVYTTSAIFKIY
jgi:hypothetical protein